MTMKERLGASLVNTKAEKTDPENTGTVPYLDP
jgi:hypothetical protein